MTVGFVLTPGASATREQPVLVAIDRALRDVGVDTERVDLPNRAPKAVERVAELANEYEEPPLLGGRSFGGRVCSMAVAEGAPCRGLVLISYPLHPPGKPETLRTEHFPKITVPCLFVSGTKDTFGTPAELTKATKKIKGAVTHVWIDGGDHGLRRKDDQVVETVRDWVDALLRDGLS